MGVALDSPLHQKACVASAAIVGGVVGAWSRNPYGVLLGFVVGAIYGKAICDKPALDRLFKDHLDFGSKMNEISGSPELQRRAVDALTSGPLSPTRRAAETMLKVCLDKVKADPEAAYRFLRDHSSAGAFGGASAMTAALINLAGDAALKASRT